MAISLEVIKAFHEGKRVRPIGKPEWICKNDYVGSIGVIQLFDNDWEIEEKTITITESEFIKKVKDYSLVMTGETFTTPRLVYRRNYSNEPNKRRTVSNCFSIVKRIFLDFIYVLQKGFNGFCSCLLFGLFGFNYMFMSVIQVNVKLCKGM